MRVVVVRVAFCFFQAEDGIRDLVRSRGLGDVYKRQLQHGRPRARRRDAASVGLERRCRQPVVPGSDGRSTNGLGIGLSLIHI